MSTRDAMTGTPDHPPPGLTLLHTLQGHTNWVESVGWSPDGTLLASCSYDQSVRLWDMSQCREVACLQGHEGKVTGVAWSPDGLLLASGSSDRSVRLWDVRKRRELARLQGHEGEAEWFSSVSSVAWSPDGSLLASGSDDETVRLWDVRQRRELVRLQGHEGKAEWFSSVSSVAWSPDGSLLASGSYNESVRLWDMRQRHELARLQGHTQGVNDVAWSPDGTLLASGSRDRTVRLWDVSQRRELARLQGHEGEVNSVAWSPDGSLLASCSSMRSPTEGSIIAECFVWRADTREPVAVLTGLQGHGFVAWHPHMTQLVTNGARYEDLALYQLDLPLLLKQSASPDTVHYKSAKIVLVGESGVGKSGLALRLTGQPYAPTDSTHGRHIWPLSTQEAALPQGRREQRETWLWDLAGQPDYRLLHQLHLHEATVALIVFDAAREADPLAGIRYWHRALHLARRAAVGSPLRVLLVAARVDRGRLGVSRAQLEKLAGELGCAGYLETSAKTGQGIEALQEALRSALQWEVLPSISSTKLLQEIKSFLLETAQAGRVLRTVDELYQSFALADRARVADAGLRGAFETVLSQLEGQGALRRLSFGKLVLLQPERLDAYASALLIAVGGQQQGLGLIAETRVQQGDFAIPEEARLADKQQERWLLLAMIEELLHHELALRVEGSLLFPSHSMREHPQREELSTQQRVTLTFAGPALSIYTTLVVRLAQSGIFEQQRVWHQVATSTTKRGGRYGLLLTLRGEERAELGLCFDDKTSKEMRVLFEAFVQQHLERLAQGSVERRQIVVCPTCSEVLPEKQVRNRQTRGLTFIVCSNCDTNVSLLGDNEQQHEASAETVSKMERHANQGREEQTAHAKLQGKIATQDFDVFLCHNGQEKPAVKRIGEQLMQQGILPWLDEWELRPGLPWQQTLEEQITKIKAAAVFVGKSGMGPWQEQELRAFLNEFVKRGCPVIPVLLPDAPVRPELPLFLKAMTWVDFRVQEPDPLQRLRWGITGEKADGRHSALRPLESHNW